MCWESVAIILKYQLRLSTVSKWSRTMSRSLKKLKVMKNLDQYWQVINLTSVFIDQYRLDSFGSREWINIFKTLILLYYAFVENQTWSRWIHQFCLFAWDVQAYKTLFYSFVFFIQSWLRFLFYHDKVLHAAVSPT